MPAFLDEKTGRYFFLPVRGRAHLYAFLSAIDNAIATACLCGLPALISVRMFSETARREQPLISGMKFPL